MANNSFMTKKGLFTISHTFDHQSKLQSIYIYNRDITVLMKHIHIKKIKNKILCDIVFLYLLIVPKQRKLEAGDDYILSPRILQNSSMLCISLFHVSRPLVQTLVHTLQTTLLRIHDPPIKLVAVVVTGLPRSAYIHVVADDEEAAASSMSAEGLSPSLFSANALVLRGLSLRRRRGPCARLFSRVPQPSSSNALHHHTPRAYRRN